MRGKAKEPYWCEYGEHYSGRKPKYKAKKSEDGRLLKQCMECAFFGPIKVFHIGPESYR